VFTLTVAVPIGLRSWKLLVTYDMSGVQVHDARLAAAMRVHGVKRILTFNDFAGYTVIQTSRPFILASFRQSRAEGYECVKPSSRLPRINAISGSRLRASSRISLPQIESFPECCGWHTNRSDRVSTELRRARVSDTAAVGRYSDQNVQNLYMRPVVIPLALIRRPLLL